MPSPLRWENDWWDEQNFNVDNSSTITLFVSSGDVDGDGFDDVIVGAYSDDDRGTASGSVYVYYGSSEGVNSSVDDKLVPLDGAYRDYFGYSCDYGGLDLYKQVWVVQKSLALCLA